MDDRSINFRLHSISYVLIHFSCSIIQLSCVCTILALQITLATTSTCAYHISAGFWSFPVLLLSPFGIWFVIWQKDRFYCLIAFTCHLLSTVFATAIIIISFLSLIDLVNLSCSTSNNYFLPINISLIGVGLLLKMSHYVEMLLIYRLLHITDEQSIISNENFYDENVTIVTSNKDIKSWKTFQSILKKNKILK